MKAEVEECFKSIIRERTARLKSEENVIHLEQTVGGYSGFLFIDEDREEHTSELQSRI